MQFKGPSATRGYYRNPEETRKLATEFKQRYPEGNLALTTYLSFFGVDMYGAAIERAGSIDPDQVIKVFDSPDFEFTAFGIPGRKLGGIQTDGIRRAWQDEVCYSKVINCKKVMLSRQAVTIP